MLSESVFCEYCPVLFFFFFFLQIRGSLKIRMQQKNNKCKQLPVGENKHDWGKKKKKGGKERGI